MASQTSGQTTHPAMTAGRSGLHAPVMALQWVFPSPVTTVVSTAPKVLGRDAACDTVLAGNETSRKHAEIRLYGPVPVIRDLSSRNGVFVNGLRVAESPLKPSDVVRLGDWIAVLVGLPSAGIDATFRSIVPGWHGGPTLMECVEPVRRIAPTDLPITIQGETGVGKEGLARAVHLWSGRTGPFIAVNCAALPATLAEAELFGYRKGAFTGADRAGLGYFRAAHTGTLLLDEIQELPAALQAKLLRAIEQREVVPLGEAHPVQVDARLVAATQESLDDAVQERRFRLDLKARLDGLTVVLPPLRERREDIAPLFLSVLREHSGGHPPSLEPKMVEQLILYDWPLNVREIVLLARRLLALHSTERMLTRAHLPASMVDGRTRAAASVRPKAARSPTGDEAAFQELVQALRDHGGNVARAAAALGVSRARAYRLLEARPDFELSAIRADGDER
ncbi:MAG: sigma 54-interacting transcriptional regulator [Deltaproteobacteria bacterium]|nr:sigma 54-interacting transcriptional regulator [Deltaproteobacteria bacterium]